ncbi:MAG: TonB C-terminal domain-containing protein, partial [Woeseiaceae bacterium]|nr:TonB C-terminal domain-containing protein [Gammaproteobacteria bacterium]NNK26308.1 TonB C-terminal domain-containing protein [Woeseiaceae bacterium]
NAGFEIVDETELDEEIRDAGLEAAPAGDFAKEPDAGVSMVIVRPPVFDRQREPQDIADELADGQKAEAEEPRYDGIEPWQPGEIVDEQEPQQAEQEAAEPGVHIEQEIEGEARPEAEHEHEPEREPEPEPEHEPEPEPIVEEPEPEPDNSEELRRLAEEEKRRQDALLEEQRLEELKRQEDEARKRQEREEAERRKREEEEKERQRQEAERKRQEDIQRQREENERRRRELEAEQRAEELETDERRFAARDSAEMAAYQFAIAQKVRRAWFVPASAGPETRCSVRVQQLPGGEVVGVNIIECNGDEAVRRSVEAAIRRASPLPEPSNADLFDRNLTLNLTLERED